MPEKINYTCLHTHTRFCDGSGEVNDFCQSAAEKGLHSIGFSAHAPITKKTGFPDPCWREKEQRLDVYIETVLEAKHRWEGRLKVFLGLEVDYIRGLMGPADSDYKDLGLDYIIGSVHFLLPPKGGPFCADHRLAEFEKHVQEGYGGDITAAIEEYYANVRSMISLGGFDILGHPDLIKKNNFGQRLFREDSDFYMKECGSAARQAGACGITVEVNTGSIIRGYLDTVYPSPLFLKCFRENNVPAVINADAHNPAHLGGHYEDARAALLAAGYDKMVLFEGRDNGKPVWSTADIT